MDPNDEDITVTLPWEDEAPPSFKPRAGMGSRVNHPNQERRSSILKLPMKPVLESRGALKDIGNSKDDEIPTAASKKRRSSLGRRVSFSTTTKIKEFEPANAGICNSTYEASDNERSLAKQRRTESKASTDRTAPENEKGPDSFAVLFANSSKKPSFQDTPGQLQKTQRFVDDSTEMTGSDDVFNVTTVARCGPDTAEEMERNKLDFGDDITCKIPLHESTMLPFVKEPESTRNNAQPSVGMKGAPLRSMNMTKHDNEPLEMTCQTPAEPFRSAEVQVPEEEGTRMELTCKAPQSKGQNLNEDLTGDAQAGKVNDGGIELTCQLPLKMTTDQRNVKEAAADVGRNGAKDFSEGKPEVWDAEHPESVNAFLLSEQHDAGMELTCKPPVHRSPKALAIQEQDHGLETACDTKMELTCKVPQFKSQNLNNDLTGGALEAEVDNAGIGLTCQLPLKTTTDGRSVEEAVADDWKKGVKGKPEVYDGERPESTNALLLSEEQDAGMELTCKPLARTTSKAQSIAPLIQEQDEGLEIACATKMELTRKVPQFKSQTLNDDLTSDALEGEVNIGATEAPNIEETLVVDCKKGAEGKPEVHNAECPESANTLLLSEEQDAGMELMCKPLARTTTKAQSIQEQDEGMEITCKSSVHKVKKITDQGSVGSEVRFSPFKAHSKMGSVDDGDTIAFNYSVMSSTRITDCSLHATSLPSFANVTEEQGIQNIRSPAASKAARPIVQASLNSEAYKKVEKAVKEWKHRLPDYDAEKPVRKTDGDDRLQRVKNDLKRMFAGIQLDVPVEIDYEESIEEEEEVVKVPSPRKRPMVSNQAEEPAPESAKPVQRMSFFQYLHRQHSKASVLDYYDRRRGKWSLQERGNHVVVHFYNAILELHLVLGHRLQSEEKSTDGSGTVLVQHWTIQSIEFKSNAQKKPKGALNEFKLAHHLLLLSLTPSKLIEMCPNTRAFQKSMNFLMLKVHEACMFILDVDKIEGSHFFFKVGDDFTITIKFYSLKCGFSFGVSFSYKGGFSACRERGMEYKRGPSHNSLMSKETVLGIFSRIDVGWKHLGKFVKAIDEYILHLEDITN